eukprot:TRINITY_DN15811_c0_g1_i1.p1 TRINITY_DN15811_c0_g1~~TRINITY_DN15811_c0_g1_i1.p1  ORF type:complete len:184 (+),score=26.04 TRINITY_DN15811_c0_g1_i1:3-554(+)
MATRQARVMHAHTSPRSSPVRSRVPSPVTTLLSGRSSPAPLIMPPWVPPSTTPGIPEAKRVSPSRRPRSVSPTSYDVLAEPKHRTPIKMAAARQRRESPVSSPAGSRTRGTSVGSRGTTPRGRRSLTPTNYYNRVQDVQRKLNLLKSELQGSGREVGVYDAYDVMQAPWVPPPGRTSPVRNRY